MPRCSSTRPNIFYFVAAVGGAAFAITILAMLATIFGDPDAPINDIIDRWSGWLITIEVVGTISAAVVALAIDRRQAEHEESDSLDDAPSTGPAANREEHDDV